MNFCSSGENTSGGSLLFRAITSNVTSGTPGALTTTTTVDAGGGGAGVQFAYMFYSNTTVNPRYWIIAKKWTSTNSETRM